MHRNYLKSKSDILLKKYKTYKNKLQTIIRQAEKHYYSTKIEEYRDNISKTWKVMNSMINKNQVKKHIDHIEINGEQINDLGIIVNKFNNFFSNIGSELKKNIPSCSKKPTDFLRNGVVNHVSLYYIELHG